MIDLSRDDGVVEANSGIAFIEVLQFEELIGAGIGDMVVDIDVDNIARTLIAYQNQGLEGGLSDKVATGNTHNLADAALCANDGVPVRWVFDGIGAWLCPVPYLWGCAGDNCRATTADCRCSWC